MYLLDSDHVVFLQRRGSPEFRRMSLRMARFAVTDFYFPIISFHEHFLGWNTYVNRANSPAGVVHGYQMMQNLLTDFANWQVASFDQVTAAKFESLRQQRIRIGTMDLRIAAIALVHGYTLLSRNLVDFQKVPGLVVEDWTKP